MNIQAALILSALLISFSVDAGSPDLASLPDLDKYKVDPYIAAAVRLQDMGRDEACRALLQAAKASQPGDDSFKIIVLCRMVFTNKPKSAFRRPAIGRPMVFGGTEYSDWPLEPIEIVDSVPFAITSGYILAGYAEPADDYLRYCITNCDWNTNSFSPLTAKQKRSALAKLLASSKWKRPLAANERVFISEQIE